MLARHGVTPSGDAVRNAPADPRPAIARVVGLLDDVERALERTRADAELSAATRSALEDAVTGYVREVRTGLAAVRDGGAASEGAAHSFVRRFAIDCWDVIAFKSA
jgi:hypothetical protein